MPDIAVTACSKIDDYKHAVEHAGGTPRVVDASLGVDAALAGAGGVLLTGGEDVDPARYGQERHSTTVPVTPERDEFEIALVTEARRRHLPILAICRGIQVLNVAAGGTLVQDIESLLPGAVQHTFKVPPYRAFDAAHDVWIDDSSQLARLLAELLNGSDSCTVNSRHHQAVKDPAPGLRVVATAPDGVIEALEDPAAPFCVGVQWHPENFWRTGEFRGLFEGFVEAARR